MPGGGSVGQRQSHQRRFRRIYTTPSIYPSDLEYDESLMFLPDLNVLHISVDCGILIPVRLQHA